ncbi:MAG: twitching motility protein PilI [Candidatus Azotimanducaceae bacterium]|jgi:twitching motility protein PilI
MSELSPYATLLAIAERSQSVAVELPAKENARTHWNGLGFSLLGHRFVVPMSEVAEIMLVPHATRLPGVKHFVLGVANVRGKLMALLDLPAYFGATKLAAMDRRRVLAIESEEQYFGFIVDESLGMQHFPQDAYKTSIEVEEMFQPFVKGGYEVAGTPWPVLSLVALAADANFEKLGQ